ncbi:Leucine rich repeat containing protein BspA family protein [Entamoeba marina]
MNKHNNNHKSKQLDSYSLLICSKYFETSNDFINIMCVCKKFKETTEKLRFNPIPIKSLKLFPQIQTQYLYSKDDTKIEGIDNYEIWYKINYDEYLNNEKNDMKYHQIIYTKKNRLNYGDSIPEKVTILGEKCFGAINASIIKDITIPFSIHSLNYKCFYFCTKLTSIDLPSSLTSLSDKCFSNCVSLKCINLSSLIQSLGCGCFNNCTQLTSINIPSSLTDLGNECFKGCTQLLGKINVPDKFFYEYKPELIPFFEVGSDSDFGSDFGSDSDSDYKFLLDSYVSNDDSDSEDYIYDEFWEFF